MRIHSSATAIAAVVLVIALGAFAGVRSAHAVLPPGNTVAQWDKIAEDTVVGSGAFQNEGLVYMAYTTNAMYRSITPGRRAGQSPDAAVIESAYTVLSHYFPAQQANLDNLRNEALAALPDDQAKTVGMRYGRTVALDLIGERTFDGLVTPIGSTSTFPTLTPGAGVWRLTPAYAAPQTPWVGQMEPFVLLSADQFLPGPPPSLSSTTWSNAFAEIKQDGSSTNPNTTQTNVAKFWTANVIRQYNQLARDVATAQGSSLTQTARLMAMVNVVGADAQIAVMNAKYHYLFWRPVTAIDPTSVKATGDGFGPAPVGFNDGNAATAEQAGWRPLIATPNHPEYPAAHGSLTSAEAAVFSRFLGTDAVNLTIHGFDPAGAAGNLNATRHFATAADLRAEIVNARIWAGVHYRFSGEAGVALGAQVASYDLAHAFLGNGDK
jgi:hypothetical protein